VAVTLYIVVEGDTEERFANQFLVPHLLDFAVCAYVSKVITRGRRGSPQAQGGGSIYAKWKNDLTIWIKQHGHRGDVWFTTMLDLYGLAGFSDSFPGYERSKDCADPYKKVDDLERAWGEDIACHRFIPYLQLHEFEALVLVDVAVLKSRFIEQASQVDILAEEIRATGKSPEQIDDGHETAPSKRISRHLPQYERQKADAGSAAAGSIGLARLRVSCPHFGKWLEALEKLASA
jgi:hypothetical protein